jgi:RimJ/RimL family protein N-acetyltransferase
VGGTGEHVGTVTLYDWHPYHGTAYYGYMIGERAHWGRGAMTEVLPLLFDFAFDTLGVRKLNAGAYDENVGSIVSFKKLGLQPEGVLRRQLRLDDRYVDQVLYGIERDQWLAHRSTLASAARRAPEGVPT